MVPRETKDILMFSKGTSGRNELKFWQHKMLPSLSNLYAINPEITCSHFIAVDEIIDV